MDHVSEDIALAVEIIRQLENLDYPAECILQAMIVVCKDTLDKLPLDQKEIWRQRLEQSFKSRTQLN